MRNERHDQQDGPDRSGTRDAARNFWKGHLSALPSVPRMGNPVLRTTENHHERTVSHRYPRRLPGPAPPAQRAGRHRVPEESGSREAAGEEEKEGEAHPRAAAEAARPARPD